MKLRRKGRNKTIVFEPQLQLLLLGLLLKPPIRIGREDKVVGAISDLLFGPACRLFDIASCSSRCACGHVHMTMAQMPQLEHSYPLSFLFIISSFFASSRSSETHHNERRNIYLIGIAALCLPATATDKSDMCYIVITKLGSACLYYTRRRPAACANTFQ